MQVAYDHEQNSRGKNLDNAPNPEIPQSIPHLTPPTSPRLQMPTLRPATDGAISQRDDEQRSPSRICLAALKARRTTHWSSLRADRPGDQATHEQRYRGAANSR